MGWIACRDRALLERLEKRKHYTSICNAGPAEYLAAFALRHRDEIWERNRGIVAANRQLFDDFFGRWTDLFDWRPPDGGCVCFPRYKGGDVEEFCRQLLHSEGVLVLPASVYESELADVPKDHFRVGIGRLGLEEGVAAFEPLPEGPAVDVSRHRPAPAPNIIRCKKMISDRWCPLLAAPAQVPDTWRKWFAGLLG